MGRRQRSLQTGTVVRTGLEVVTIQLHPLQLRTEVLRRAKVRQASFAKRPLY